MLLLDGPPHTDAEVDAIFDDFKQLLCTAYATLDVKEQPGASQTFAKLRQMGIKVVLNTGYDRATAESLIAQIDWTVGTDIDGLVTASDVTNGRPAPDMIWFAMSLAGVELSKLTERIGDSAIDIEEGKRANCGMTLGVPMAAHTAAQLRSAAPTHIVASLGEMSDLILAAS
ncbi:HAD family hydrolase [Planctomycetaceae bacterium SH139]